MARSGERYTPHSRRDSSAHDSSYRSSAHMNVSMNANTGSSHSSTPRFSTTRGEASYAGSTRKSPICRHSAQTTMLGVSVLVL